MLDSVCLFLEYLWGVFGRNEYRYGHKTPPSAIHVFVVVFVRVVPFYIVCTRCSKARRGWSSCPVCVSVLCAHSSRVMGEGMWLSVHMYIG